MAGNGIDYVGVDVKKVFIIREKDGSIITTSGKQLPERILNKFKNEKFRRSYFDNNETISYIVIRRNEYEEHKRNRERYFELEKKYFSSKTKLREEMLRKHVMSFLLDIGTHNALDKAESELTDKEKELVKSYTVWLDNLKSLVEDRLYNSKLHYDDSSKFTMTNHLGKGSIVISLRRKNYQDKLNSACK